MTKALRWLSVYLLAALLGIGSAWGLLRSSYAGNHQIRVGAWHTGTLVGSRQADLLTRARVALDGLLALGRDETMYYIARQDDRGQPLRARCAYRIDGMAPPARWWSITVYADDLYLFDAPERRFSVNGDTVPRGPGDRFALSTGPRETAGLVWIPTPGAGGLVLALRLYQPQASLQAAPQSLAAPRIQPIGACS